MAFKDVMQQLQEAQEGKGMFGREDYYSNPFAIQDSLDAALLAKEIEAQAEAILNDPVALENFLLSNADTVGETASPGTAGISIGVGPETEGIKGKAFQQAVVGLITGGVPGAIQKGVSSYIKGTLNVLNEVNKTNDPIGALNAKQGWTVAPAPVVSGMLNYNTPYNTAADSRFNPAPVVSGRTNYNTPYSADGNGGFGGQDGRGGQTDSALTGYTE